MMHGCNETSHPCARLRGARVAKNVTSVHDFARRAPRLKRGKSHSSSALGTRLARRVLHPARGAPFVLPRIGASPVGFAQSIAAFEPQARGPATESRPGPEFPSLIGASPSFRAAVAMAKRVAAFPAANVLLVGETGTGKELFARAIHNASAVADDPFVAINCSAIPEAMLESELFGHEKGAFTDARSSKRGLLQVAGRGTIMLDEVQDLSPSLQPKLLRVLEERRVRRLGALTEYDVDCRIIAAANKDLASPTEEGRFRSDLYYRLSVVRIDLPSLRKRPKDLELLACHFLETLCREYELPIKRLAGRSDGRATLAQLAGERPRAQEHAGKVPWSCATVR